MQQRVLILVTFILATAFIVQQSQAKCNSCGENGISCFNDTSFYMCYNGIADTTLPFTCPNNMVCTALQVKCVAPSTTNLADCSAASTGCGLCEQNKLFACTSRTTFAQCNGTTLMSGVSGTCPSGLTCDSAQAEICVDDCKIDTIECDMDAPAAA